MARSPRIDIGGYPYHILNRSNGGFEMFRNEKEYRAFESLLYETIELVGIRILAYCIMPNHWHIVAYPEQQGQMPDFVKRMSQSHAQLLHLQRNNVGTGHVYQDRYKSFPIQHDQHLLQVLRYVERNPVRAKLVASAHDWRWGSYWTRISGPEKRVSLLSEWPIIRPSSYDEWVNEVEHEGVLEQIRNHIQKNKAYGDTEWGKFLIR